MNNSFLASSHSSRYIKLGVLIIVLANPLLYLTLGSVMIDIKNLFGASIDRQSISFNTNDYFIQAMGLVATAGIILLLLGLCLRWKNSKVAK
ncbi:MAG: hypothetical protein WAZ21_03425 [Candidatus Saccharimonadales bacterium]